MKWRSNSETPATPSGWARVIKPIFRMVVCIAAVFVVSAVLYAVPLERRPLSAALSFLFLVLIVRVVGRRPGKQLTPFEFVLIFYLGGLTLTGMVGPEASLTNAITQILTVACCHYALAYLRYRSDRFARILDGIPLVLLDRDQWRQETLVRMRIQDDDAMNAARQEGIRDLSGIKAAVLESYGEINIIPSEERG